MGKNADTPPTPDYGSIAQEQGQVSSQLMHQQTTENRPDTQTPWGSQQWAYNPATQTWSGNESLNPTEQGTLNTQQGVQSGLATATSNLASGADANLFNGGINYGNVGSIQGGNYYNPAASNAVWSQFQQMQEPLQQQQTQSQQAQLEAQGLRPGDAAYDTTMRNLSNTQYGQTQSAEDQAVLAGEQEAQTMQGMDVQAQNANYTTDTGEANNQLNLFNSLYGNTGVQNPAQPSATPAGVSQTPNLLNAQEQTYASELNAASAQNAANSSTAQGIGDLGLAAALYFA